MFKFIKYSKFMSFLVLISFLTGCGKDEKQKNKDQEVKVSEVIQQEPGPQDLLTGAGQSSFHRKHLDIVSNETDVEFKDNAAGKTGWALWRLKDIFPANQNYNINMKINKGTTKGQYSQVQIKFLVEKVVAGKYFYLFLAERGKAIAQQQATKDMVQVADKGDYWLVSLQVKSPEKPSVMDFLVLPATGAKEPIGVLGIKSIQMTQK